MSPLRRRRSRSRIGLRKGKRGAKDCAEAAGSLDEIDAAGKKAPWREKTMMVKKNLTVMKWSPLIAFVLFIILMPAIFPCSGKIGLYLQAIGVCTSVIISVMAIWGEPIRAFIAGPKLKVTLHDPEGELTSFTGGGPVYYYHLRISNDRKGTIAKNVRVLISSIEWGPQNGRREKLVSFDTQLEWKNSARVPQFLSIGPDALCDLGYLPQVGGFRFAVPLKPNNFPDAIGPNESAKLEIMAAADNAQSRPIIVEILWDGEWPKNKEDAKNHLKIK